MPCSVTSKGCPLLILKTEYERPRNRTCLRTCLFHSPNKYLIWYMASGFWKSNSRVVNLSCMVCMVATAVQADVRWNTFCSLKFLLENVMMPEVSKWMWTELVTVHGKTQNNSCKHGKRLWVWVLDPVGFQTEMLLYPLMLIIVSLNFVVVMSIVHCYGRKNTQTIWFSDTSCAVVVFHGFDIVPCLMDAKN